MEMLTKIYKTQMKKLILATAVVALFTACHSTTEADLEAADSTTVKVDTLVKVDTTKTIVDTIKK